jgi:hypothetical protein
MKPYIVEFKNGTFGIRKGFWGFWWYLGRYSWGEYYWQVYPHHCRVCYSKPEASAFLYRYQNRKNEKPDWGVKIDV